MILKPQVRRHPFLGMGMGFGLRDELSRF